MKSLLGAATDLRDYLVSQDFGGDDGEIPDSIWSPFCAAIDAAERTHPGRRRARAARACPECGLPGKKVLGFPWCHCSACGHVYKPAEAPDHTRYPEGKRA